MRLTNFILDVDGVMTDGKIYYGEGGKIFKVFGAHDSDGLKMLRGLVKIEFITADASGFPISYRRIVEHMGYELNLVSERERFNYITNKYNTKTLAFMGDGYYDSKIFPHVAVSIAPRNARLEAIEAATHVTRSNSSEGAVMDACLYLKELIDG